MVDDDGGNRKGPQPIDFRSVLALRLARGQSCVGHAINSAKNSMTLESFLNALFE
jgi:hypothetical protein